MYRRPHHQRLRSHYRFLTMKQMRDAGHSLKTIGDYYYISAERVRQILKRGQIPAQLNLPVTRETNGEHSEKIELSQK